MLDSRRRAWTLAIVSVGLFMVVLDNLVERRAAQHPPRPRRFDPGARVDGQRLHPRLCGVPADRRRARRPVRPQADVHRRDRPVHASSAAAALAPTTGTLIAARAVQGLGAAIATPLTLTLLADAFPPTQRGLAIGVWSGISGVAVALGPLVGGAVVQAASWHWIFWINVPIGAGPHSARRRPPDRESRTECLA